MLWGTSSPNLFPNFTLLSQLVSKIKQKHEGSISGHLLVYYFVLKTFHFIFSFGIFNSSWITASVPNGMTFQTLCNTDDILTTFTCGKPKITCKSTNKIYYKTTLKLKCTILISTMPKSFRKRYMPINIKKKMMHIKNITQLAPVTTILIFGSFPKLFIPPL